MNDSSGSGTQGRRKTFSSAISWFSCWLLWADVADPPRHVPCWATPEGLCSRTTLLALWLHDRGKQLALVVFVGDGDVGLASGGSWKRLSKDQRLIALIAVLASLLSVSLIKHTV
jgi:hypothetical protein